MNTLKGILLTCDGPPTEVAVKVSSVNDDLPKVVQRVLGCQDTPVMTNCGLGVLYCSTSSEHDREPRNTLATQLRYRFSSQKMPEGLSVTHGRAFLLGDDQKGGSKDVDRSIVKKVSALYEEMTGHPAPGHKEVKKSMFKPKRAKSPWNYFSRAEHERLKKELEESGQKLSFNEKNQRVNAAWNNATEEQKAPFVTESEADHARYNEEMKEYRLKNPRPPTKPLSGYNVYCKDFPIKANRRPWKELSKEEQQPFDERAKQDKGRYERELAAFHQHCLETGKDFEALTARKSKKRKADGDAEPKPKKRKRKSKKKVDDDQEEVATQPMEVDDEE